MGSTFESLYTYGVALVLFFFRGRVYFCWLELVKLFRLYLDASLCTLLFLALLGYSCYGEYIFFLCFLFQTAY